MNFSEFFRASENKDNCKNIILIGWMNFCWGIATSMMFTLLPLFIIDELGGSSKSFGMLEGGVIFLSFMARLFAGFFIDIFKKKIPMLLAGTILTIISKIALACSGTILFVFFAKSIDRFAKGLRQAPTDTMLADLATNKGFAYSLKYMMNTGGALIGSAISSLAMLCFPNNFRLVFAMSAVPTVIALYILKSKITYNDNKNSELTEKQKWSIKSISLMPRDYWNFIGVIAILMLARFDIGFIAIRAMDTIPNYARGVPLFTGIYEIFAVLAAIPIGKLSDRIDKRIILLFGIFFLLVGDLVGLFAYNTISIILIYLCAGIHIGATHGVIYSIIAKSTPTHLIGTAFAIFYGTEAITLWLANNIAGFSPQLALSLGLSASAGPFVIGIIASVASMIYIGFLLNGRKSQQYIAS